MRNWIQSICCYQLIWFWRKWTFFGIEPFIEWFTIFYALWFDLDGLDFVNYFENWNEIKRNRIPFDEEGFLWFSQHWNFQFEHTRWISTNLLSIFWVTSIHWMNSFIRSVSHLTNNIRKFVSKLRGREQWALTQQLLDGFVECLFCLKWRSSSFSS